MIDYDITPYRELKVLAAEGDQEAVKRLFKLDIEIDMYKKYATWAMTGSRTDIPKGEIMEWFPSVEKLPTKRMAGRWHIENILPYKKIFHYSRREKIEKFLFANYEDEYRPDWIDLIAPALYICVSDPAIYGNFTCETVFENQLRPGPQKRRGLLWAAVTSEVEKSLFGGKTSSSYAHKKENPQSNLDRVKKHEYSEKPQLQKRDELRESALLESDKLETDIIKNIKSVIAELGLSPEDEVLLYIEQGDIERMAEEREMKPGTLRQKRARLIAKIREKMM